ncbi:hypothetical protein PtA15_10A360 [Puccinia triticina]|uniref:Uncharacterized protein n=1 Tax=Puccinia triticina TaxID=208348 RepID=A0ABY7CY56_9BASI|nr:uncharacterized protein PtA15_10A360 [Puccinia triticina]WAQ88937.1 hypothetical protein PtA15_10A360 [Puccinia triticina]
MPYRAVREDERGGRAAEQPGDQPPAAAAGAAGSAGFSGLGAGSLVSRLLFFLTAESSQSRFWWGAAPWLGLIPPLSSNSSDSDSTKMPHSHVKHSSQDTKKSQTKVLKSPNRPKNSPKREIPIKFPKPNKTNLNELISQKPDRVEDRRQPPKVSKNWRDHYSSCSNPPISESTSSDDADDEGFANGCVENNDSETDDDTAAYKPPKRPSKGHRRRGVVESEHDSGSVSNDADCSNSDNTNGHGSDSANNSDANN